MLKIHILLGDITEQPVDAIVNAANNTLLGGGGVDGAIHRKAGLELLRECRTLNGCKTGESKITKGYNLPAKYIIHTVGPIWAGGVKKERTLLNNCYFNSLKLAEENDCKTIAFPAISTGIYRYPLKEAVEVAVSAVSNYGKANENSTITDVYFICFDDKTKQVYAEEFKKVLK